MPNVRPLRIGVNTPLTSSPREVALEELNTLRGAIDSRASSSTTGPSSTSSTAISDPALFVYFNHPNGRTLLLDTFMAPAYSKPPVHGSCATLPLPQFSPAKPPPPNKLPAYPSRHVYGTPSATSSKSSRWRSTNTKTPSRHFLKELYVEFEAAQKALKEAVDVVVGTDFFLGEFKYDFLDNARYWIYCRIHQKIDIGDLSERLNVSPDEGEKWIMNLIREIRMGADAKIDLEKNVIEIHRPPQPVYQTVIGKTRGLALRTQAIGAAVARAGGAMPFDQQPQQQVGGDGMLQEQQEIVEHQQQVQPQMVVAA